MKNPFISHRWRLQLSSLLLLSSFAFSILPLSVKAQTEEPRTRQLIADDKPAGNQKRLALVIGNADYKYTAKLKNAANDAIDVAAAFRELGFEVIEGVNQDKRGMEKLILDFGNRLYKQGGGTGVFFFAGHGVQFDGKNYLVPVDADIPTEDEIQYRTVEMSLLLRKFVSAKNNLNIIILDACRNNPFAKEWSESRNVSADDGLAKMAAPKGTILLYATEPGKVALDGDGRNGTFTEALLQHIKKPNLELDSMYKAVARSVSEKSKNKQLPYKEGTNVDDFYFAGTSENPTPGRQAPVIMTDEDAKVTVKDAALRERETWDAVKTQTDAESFRIYLEAYPNGANAVKAKIKLEQLVWDSVKSSNDKLKIQSYLKEFSDGANSAMARIKLRQLEARETTVADNSAEVEESPVKEPLPDKVKPKAEKPKLTPVPVIGKKRGKTDPTIKNEVRTNSVGMELVSIPAGSFMMGLSPGGFQETLRYARKEYADEDMPTWFDNEKPQRKVTFSDGFWMGKTEVTQAQWAAVMGETPNLEKDCGECPIRRVSWESAKLFIEKLNERNDGFEYRLPSEAEWEYAARAGTTGLFAGPIDEMAWHNGNADGKTHPVGLTRANAYGLFDMYGNVEEWCEDVYSPSYEGLPVDGSANIEIGETKRRVIRGGSWNNFPTKSRSTARNSHLASSISATIGFRVAARLK